MAVQETPGDHLNAVPLELLCAEESMGDLAKMQILKQ